MRARFGSIAKYCLGVSSAVALVVAAAPSVYAQGITSDQTAGYVVFPKVVSDPTDMFGQGRTVDTLIQLTNTSNSPQVVHCWYVDATGLCNNGMNAVGSPAGECRDDADCLPGGTCEPQWSANNFSIVLSPNQPTGWVVSAGGPVPAPGAEVVPPVSLDFFVGELKCVQVDGDSVTASTITPINANDLKGEATVYEVAAADVDVRSYNAIGFPAVSEDGLAQNDTTLCLGDTAGNAECAAAEYASCSSRLLLTHWFDGAQVSADTDVHTGVTMVPCTQNFEQPDTQVETVVQFLVFNEFEQRFSASTEVDCFRETLLSQIDRRPGQETTSIFHVAVQGTLTGQTHVRGVLGPDTSVGHGLLAVAEEFYSNSTTGETGSTALNVNYAGVNAGRGDFVRYTIP
mgnify:CR=1 FL=1